MLFNRNKPGAGVEVQDRHLFFNSVGVSWHVKQEVLQNNLQVFPPTGFK